MQRIGLAQVTAQRQDAAAAAAEWRSRRCCPRQWAPGFPRSGQSGRAAAAVREATGAAEGREAAMRPKAEGQLRSSQRAQPPPATAASAAGQQADPWR